MPPSGPLPYNPHLHPWTRAIGSGGVNLGLVSANPLFSFQIEKDEYGEKVFKPLLHVHVVPNHETIATIGQLFDQKKRYLLNKHQYYALPPPPIHPIPFHPAPPHHYFHHGPPPHPHPYEHLHEPIYYKSSQHHRNSDLQHHIPPVYSPDYTHYETNYKDSSPHEPQGYSDDYYDNNDGGDDYPDSHYPKYDEYSRSNKVNDKDKQEIYAKKYPHSKSRSLKYPSEPSGANRGGQTIRFPDTRRKREIIIGNSTIDIQEVIYPLFLNAMFHPRYYFTVKCKN